VPQDIEALQDAFDTLNYPGIGELSHKLKSSMAIFSRSDLESLLSGFIEQARQHDVDLEILHTFALLKEELSAFYPSLYKILEKLKKSQDQH
jgi:hypothetical protein